MGKRHKAKEQGEQHQSDAPRKKGFASWQWALVAVAVFAMIGGVAAPFVLGDGEAPTAVERSPDASARAAAMRSGFAPGVGVPGEPVADPAGTAVAPADGDDTTDALSPAIFRVGFSFFVGFAIAYALRTFVKISLVGLGMFLLLLFGLQYGGFITVNWNAVGDKYDSWAAWLESEVSSFWAFITGYLPSAAAAAGGLAVGFKRR